MSLSAKELVNLDEEDFHEEEIIWIDHRSCEDEIIEYIAEKLDIAISPVWKGEELWVEMSGKEWKVPLTFTRHDRYVALSSLAEILKDDFTFWLLKDSLEDDTHGLLLTSNQVSVELMAHHSSWLNSQLEKMSPGYDYFSGTDVPCLNKENNNPNFNDESQALDESLKEYKAELISFLNNDGDFQAEMKDLRRQLGTDNQGKGTFLFKQPWLLVLLVFGLYYFVFG